MKKQFTYIILSFIFANTFAQQSKTVKNLDFDKISIIGKIYVELIESDSSFMEMTFTGVEEDKITIYNEDNLLKIKLNTPSKSDTDVNIKIYCKKLSEIMSNSNAMIASKNIMESEDKLYLKSASGGEIQLKVSASHIITKSTMGGMMILTGQCNTFESIASIGGTVNALELQCETAKTKATSDGKIRVNASEKLEATTSFGGIITYKGEPRRTKFKEGKKNTILKAAN